METREELIKNKGYWIAKIQTKLFREIYKFMEKKHLNNTQLAEYLGCSKGYVSQLLNGDFDHKLSKLVELSLALDKVPQLEFVDKENFLEEEATYEGTYCIEKFYDNKLNFKNAA